MDEQKRKQLIDEYEKSRSKVNEEDKRLLLEITKTFDASAMVISELAEEIVKLRSQYGERSKFVEVKKSQLAQVRQLYDQALNYINYLRTLNVNMAAEFHVQELVRYHKETGLPYSRIAELIGDNDPLWKQVDDWDAKIKRIKTNLNIPPELDEEFYAWIEERRKFYNSTGA
jgi:hypothetical protein